MLIGIEIPESPLCVEWSYNIAFRSVVREQRYRNIITI